MNFEEALSQAKSGKKIFREKWQDDGLLDSPKDSYLFVGEYVFLDETLPKQSILYIYNPKHCRRGFYNINQHDLFADDWQILNQ